MYAIVKETHAIFSGNIQTPRGNRAHKDRTIKKGQMFQVVEFKIATGLATYGSQCVVMRDERDGYIMKDFRDRFDYTET